MISHSLLFHFLRQSRHVSGTPLGCSTAGYDFYDERRCGDGRVLVAAARRFGCRGVGIDVSQACINAAFAMVAAEDAAAFASEGPESEAAMSLGQTAAASPSASGSGASCLLSERLTWIVADCTKANPPKRAQNSAVCVEVPPSLAEIACEHNVTCCYLYIYPTLLSALR